MTAMNCLNDSSELSLSVKSLSILENSKIYYGGPGATTHLATSLPPTVPREFCRRTVGSGTTRTGRGTSKQEAGRSNCGTGVGPESPDQAREIQGPGACSRSHPPVASERGLDSDGCSLQTAGQDNSGRVARLRLLVPAAMGWGPDWSKISGVGQPTL